MKVKAMELEVGYWYQLWLCHLWFSVNEIVGVASSFLVSECTWSWAWGLRVALWLVGSSISSSKSDNRNYCFCWIISSDGNNNQSVDIVQPNFEKLMTFVWPISHYDWTWHPNIMSKQINFKYSFQNSIIFIELCCAK